MISPATGLLIVHLFGLALAVGAASVKVASLLRCRVDSTFIGTHVRIAKLTTRQIKLGMLLLVLSGVVWLVLGYPFTARLIMKLVLVALIGVSGALIDRIERRFEKLAPSPGMASSTELTSVLKQYLTLEITATLLFYAIIVLWVVR